MGVPRGTPWKRNLQKKLQDTVREGEGVGNVELKKQKRRIPRMDEEILKKL